MGTDDSTDASKALRMERILAALFYGASSLAVIFVNKIIMSEYAFPYFDFLAAVQFAATTVILSLLIIFRKIDSIPAISFSVIGEVLPISVMFLGNVLCGLGSTRSLNLPMFTALRRFSILMTMVAESCMLGSKPSSGVVLSVAMMVGGAVIAAVFDLSFDLQGYVLVFMNNIFTALNGVWMKKALGPKGQCSKMAVLYYNSLFCGIVMLLFFSSQHLSVSHANSLQIAMSRNMHLPGKVSAHAEALLGVPKVGVVTIVDRVGGLGEGTAGAADRVEAGGGSITRRYLHQARSLVDSALGYVMSAEDGKGASIMEERELRGARRGGGEASVTARAAAIAGSGVGVATLENPANGDAVLLQSTISQILDHPGWQRLDFILLFLAASLMGSILNYSIFLCTTLNSALTTAVIGCLKNVLTTYVGMLFFTDYRFGLANFCGLNLSIAGSLYYTWITLFRGEKGFGQ